MLPVDQRTILMLPGDARVLSVIVKGGLPHLYYVANEKHAPEPRVFRIVCSGEHFEPGDWIYISSFQLNDWFVGHLFEQPASGGAPDEIDPRFADDFAEINEEMNDGQ